jgi:RNA polymerase sigma-70 factor, ECF subfamily
LRLTRLAVAITRNQHDAEDAVQATLIKVLANNAALLHSKTPWPYLLRMVRNEALVILRKRKKWSILDGLSDLLTRRNVDTLEQEESMKAVWTALRRLPTDQCEVVVLKIWEDMTFAEIGSTLGIPATTAASRYRYATLKLEQMLRSHDYEEVK